MKTSYYFIFIVLIVYVGCSKQSIRKEFYSSGELWKEQIYHSRDTSIYLERVYFRNGQLKSSGYYLNGKRDGIWQGWFTDGTIHWEAEYINGTPKPVPEEDPFIHVRVLGTDSAWTWYADTPLYLQVYIEGATPYNANVACYCDFMLPIDTIDNYFSIGVIPRKPGAMMFEILYLENGKYYSISQDTIYVYPNPEKNENTDFNFDEIEHKVFNPPMSEK